MKYYQSGDPVDQVFTEDYEFSGVNLWLVGKREGRKLIAYDVFTNAPLRACEEEVRHLQREKKAGSAVGIAATDQFGAELAFAGFH
ncbi:MAG: hypothetical protein ACWGQW_04295 [bacterium]